MVDLFRLTLSPLTVFSSLDCSQLQLKKRGKLQQKTPKQNKKKTPQCNEMMNISKSLYTFGTALQD